jgi:hypothetical protein
MTGNFFDPMWTAKVTEPVKLVGEQSRAHVSQGPLAHWLQP